MSKSSSYGVKLNVGAFRPVKGAKLPTFKLRVAWWLRSLADKLDGQASYGIHAFSNVPVSPEIWAEAFQHGFNGIHSHLLFLLSDSVVPYDEVNGVDGLDNRRKPDNTPTT